MIAFLDEWSFEDFTFQSKDKEQLPANETPQNTHERWGESRPLQPMMDGMKQQGLYAQWLQIYGTVQQLQVPGAFMEIHNHTFFGQPPVPDRIMSLKIKRKES